MRGKAGFHKGNNHTRQKSGKNNGKSGSTLNLNPPAQLPKCPECNSKRVWRDGLRYTRQGEVQRYLCRACGYRFSEPKKEIHIAGKSVEGSNHILDSRNIHTANFFPRKKRLNNPSFSLSEDVSSHEITSPTILTMRKHLNTLYPHNKDCRVCETDGVSKNLSQQRSRQKRAAGATKPDKATVKGKIIEFLFWMQKQGYPKATVEKRVYSIKRLVDLGANLWQPETVKEILAQQTQWKESYKKNIAYAYENFLEMEGLTWQMPNYRMRESLPFVPLEAELDQLIASCGKVLGTFLQGLKDTGADPGELAHLRWIDINLQSRTVTINHPVKNHNTRIVAVSNEFIQRLQTLPKKGEKIFSYESVRSTFYHSRKRIAAKLANPRLLEISFNTFRHWKATMEYHRTKDILYVMKLLGHKSIKSTMKYIDLEKAIYGELGSEDFTVKVAENTDEACRLVEVGFEYVTGEYTDGGKIFRKRK